MTRDERLVWIKERAMNELVYGRTDRAYASMISDLGTEWDGIYICGNNTEIIPESLIFMGYRATLQGPTAMINWINGFH